MGRFKPLEKILTNVVDTLGNKIGALPSPNVLFDEYNIALKNKMVSKIKGIVEDMPNTMNLPYEIGQKLNSEGKLPLPIGTSLLPLGGKGYPDEVHKIIGYKGNIYNPDLYGYEIQAPNGDIFFQAISNPKLGLREQKVDKVGSFTAALGPEGVAEMRFVPPSRPVRQFVERSQISEAEQKVSDLGALPKNLTNAKKQGFDIDNKLYHATNSDNITEFREDLIGSSTDEGFFGKGFYFTPNKGEAGYYGKNVGEYFVKGKLLDLTNNSGDYTLGGTVKFVDWAEKLDKIGMLDKVTKDGLRAAKKMHKYLDKNIEYKIGQNPDGTDGVFATIVDPTRKVDIYKGKEYPPTISVMTDNRRFFPKTKEEAKENLLHQFVYQMSNQYDNNGYTKSNDFFKGWNNDILLSLSDYIRVGGKGSAELTKKAKQAGYDGILAPGDEVVVFDPKNIRSTSAEFDPNKSESKNILASMGGMATVGGIGALSGLEEGT
jgi:hypothetical protein